MESDLDELTWQEFEELLRDILDQHDFEIQFRKIFKPWRPSLPDRRRRISQRPVPVHRR